MNAVKRILFVATLLLLLVPGTPTFAQEGGVDQREFTIVPYLWAPNIKGEMTIGRQTGNVDIGADAVLDEHGICRDAADGGAIRAVRSLRPAELFQAGRGVNRFYKPIST
ncbi:MAG: hypothetical protein MPW15_11310 [Candidatus Manganitrophus sp.]|nr:hypothetical protein [Candidatus Manganitrophus sp.]